MKTSFWLIYLIDALLGRTAFSLLTGTSMLGVHSRTRTIHSVEKKSIIIKRTNTILKSSQSQQKASNSFRQRSKSWIVLVDDEESIRLSIGKYLYDAGYTVSACADGEALLELLTLASTGNSGVDDGEVISLGAIGNEDDRNDTSTTSPLDLESMPTKFPSVIICDIRMPGGMNGLQLLDILKNNPSSSSQLVPNNTNDRDHSGRGLGVGNNNCSTVAASPRDRTPSNPSFSNDLDFIRLQWKKIPVILLTAKSLTQDRIEGYRRGADVYLPKPFAPEELLSIVDNLVRRMRELGSGISDAAGEDGAVHATSMNDLKNDLIEIKGLLRNARELAEQRRKDSIRGNTSKKNNNRQMNKRLNPAASSSQLPALSSYTSSSSPTLPPSSALVTRENAKEWSKEVDEIRNNVILTPTEIEVLRLLSDGNTNGEIAKLANDGDGITVIKVGKTISSLYAKTLTKTRTELVRWGIKAGHVPLK